MKIQLRSIAGLGLVAAAVAVVAMISVRHSRAGNAEEPASPVAVVAVKLASAATRPMREVLPASGRIEPLPGQETAVSPAAAGIVTAVYVKEGDWVKAGQPLVQLNPSLQAAAVRQSTAQLREAQAATTQAQIDVSSTATDVDAEVTAAQSALQTAKLQLAQAQQESAAQPRISSAAVDQAKADLNSAQQELARLRAGARPEEIQQAQAAVNRASALMQAAKRDMDRTARLVRGGVKPGKDLQDATTAYTTAQADYSSADEALKLLQKGARSEDVRIAEAKVNSAEAAVKSAEADQVQVQLKSGAVDIAKQQVSAAEKALRTARAHRAHVASQQAAAAQARARQSAAGGALQSSEVQRQMTIVRAPISGCVVARMTDPGEAADPAAPLLKIADLNTVRIAVNVPVDALPKVRTGQTVEVLAADHKLIATGTVTTIGKTVDTTNNTVPVWATVPNPMAALSSGQFVDAQIVIRQQTAATAVPVAAVLPKDGGDLLFVVDNRHVAHQRKVTLGLQEGGFVQVIHGVQSGDIVVTEGNYELSDGMKVKPLNTPGKGD